MTSRPSSEFETLVGSHVFETGLYGSLIRMELHRPSGFETELFLLVHGINGVLYQQKSSHERRAKIEFNSCRPDFLADLYSELQGDGKSIIGVASFSIIFPISFLIASQCSEIIALHRVIGDGVSHSLYFIYHHNTQVLDVWTSTFIFLFPWNGCLFVLQIIITAVAGLRSAPPNVALS